MCYYNSLHIESIYYFCEIDYVFKTEEWLPIVGYEGIYEVSDLGRIKSLKRIMLKKGIYPFESKEKILKKVTNGNGYYFVSLSKNKIKKALQIHQIVAESFFNHTAIDRNLVINHKNFNRLDNRKINLEIVTIRENSNKKHIKSSSKYIGVSWYQTSNKWRSCIFMNGKLKHIGYFKEEIDASNAYETALENHLKTFKMD